MMNYCLKKIPFKVIAITVLRTPAKKTAENVMQRNTKSQSENVAVKHSILKPTHSIVSKEYFLFLFNLFFLPSRLCQHICIFAIHRNSTAYIYCQ